MEAHFAHPHRTSLARVTDPLSQQGASVSMPTASGMVSTSTNPVEAHNLDGGALAGK
jgi:hypothetical protein